MGNHWVLSDEHRINGAVGALQDAAYLSTALPKQGPCPLSESEIEDVIKLAEGAITLLKRVGNTR